jgi:hypothetical protein
MSPHCHHGSCNKLSNFTAICLLQPEIQALKTSKDGDAIKLPGCPMMEDIDGDTMILDDNNGRQFYTVILPVITPQPIVCFNPPDQR